MRIYDDVITQPTLRQATRQLFVDEHYTRAVEGAFKCLNNVVKNRAQLGADGAGLMRTAFSAQQPILRINPMRTQSQRDEQQDFMEIVAGCITGIRNPRAHEHQYADERRVALEMLTMANHLMHIALSAKRARRRAKS